MMTTKKQIFLSYGRGDNPDMVRQVAEALNSQSTCRAWYDKLDLPAVTQFTDEIATAIENSEYLVLFIGNHSLDSVWCEREWRHALNHCIPIIPVLAKGTWGDIGEKLPKRIRNINGVDGVVLPIEKVISEIMRLTSVQPDPLCDVRFAKALPTYYIPRDTYLDAMKHVIGIGDRTAKDATKMAGYVGVGGIGKTTLANALAQDCESRRTFDYIFWLTLGENTTANDANRLLYQIGETFGDAREDYQDLEKARTILSYHLRDKHTLIVLDDAWKDTQDLIHAFQFPNIDCRLLITTRSHSLLADVGTRAVSVDKLTVDEGVQLMHAIKPYADDGQKATYAEIVTFLDGHALAVQLASSQLNFYPPDRLLERLKKNALEANPFSDLIMDTNDRNASLERSLQLSYGDLGGDDPAQKADLQRRFRGLGIFAPNSTYPPEALKAMWDDADEFYAEDQAVELVKIGLLGRFGLRFGHHSLLTAYARALLLRADEKEALFPKYADWYIGRAKEIFVDLYDKPELWGDGEGELNFHDVVNITSLGRDLVYLTQDGTTGDLERALVFAVMTPRYVQLRMEARAWDWLEMGLNAVRALRRDKVNDADLLDSEAFILNELGLMKQNLNYPYDALLYYEEGLVLRRQQGNKREEATILCNIGKVYDDLGNKQMSLVYYEQVLPIDRALDNRLGEATTLNNIGFVYSSLGDNQKALAYYEQALPIRREVGDRGGEAQTLNNMGLVYSALGEKQKALAYYEQALPIRREVRDRGGEARTLNNIGLVYFDLGEKQKALEYYEQALPLHRAVGNRGVEAVTCFNMGMVYESLGDLDRAIALVERCVILDEQIQHPDLESDRGYLIYLKRQRGDADVLTNSRIELHMKELVALYQQSEEALRQFLKKRGLLDNAIEKIVNDVVQFISKQYQSLNMPSELIQQWIQNTYAVLRHVPEKRDEWLGILEANETQISNMGDNWAHELAFVEALLAILRGEKPVLPNDNPYADAVKQLLDALNQSS